MLAFPRLHDAMELHADVLVLLSESGELVDREIAALQDDDALVARLNEIDRIQALRAAATEYAIDLAAVADQELRSALGRL